MSDPLPSTLYEALDKMGEKPRSAGYYERLAEHLRFCLAMRGLKIGGSVK